MVSFLFPKALTRVLMVYLLFWVLTLTVLPARAAEGVLPGGDFCLSGNEGKRCLSDYKGDVVLLYFGYMTCPDVCPTSLLMLSEAFKGLNTQTKNSTKVLFVTLDPERDQSEGLHNYLSYFNPGFLGLTGDIVQIRRAADQYGVQFQKVPIDSAIGYAIDHSAAIYLINAQGDWLGQFKHQTPVQDIVEGIIYAHQDIK